MKTCTQCKAEKPVAEFYVYGENSGRAAKIHAKCKRCQHDNRNEHRKQKPELAATVARRHKLKSKFNTTPEFWDWLFQVQGGVCAICQCGPSDTYRLHLDHDRSCCPGERSCGKCLRGLLCKPCNQALGLLGDCIPRLASAITYLQAPTTALIIP